MYILPGLIERHPDLLHRSPEMNREESEQLTREFFEATDALGLANKEISQILGVSEATISRAKKRSAYFSRTRRHQWAIAELIVKARGELVRIFDHPRKEKHWFTTYNHHLRALPIDLLHSYEGLVQVLRYLEAQEVYKKEVFKIVRD
jgi:uncharacterized protein (DUF2384 family)